MREALLDVGFEIRYIAAVGVLPFRSGNPYNPESLKKSTTQTNIQQSTESVQKSSFIQRHKSTLRPIWLTVKRAQELPFVLLSALNIHIGAKLIVYAVKPSHRFESKPALFS